MIYLDHNASSPMLPEVRRALLRALDDLPGNPSSPHAEGRRAALAIEEARAQIAGLVRRDSREVIFTSCATESNALALSTAPTPQRPELWVSAVEHPSALAWGTRRLPVDGQGRLDLDALKDALGRDGGRVAVVSVQAANNETGVLQPTAEILALCRAAGVTYHCDATQLPGRLPWDVDADLITLSAHKVGGPRGAGALIGRPSGTMLRGGPQERGLRAGTPNTAAIVGFGVAAQIAGARPARDPADRDQLEAACRALGARVLSAAAPRLPNTLSAIFDAPGDLLVAALDLEGVAASTGSACASGASEPSLVLAAMGEQGVPVRLSLGPDRLDPEDVDHVARALRRALELWR